MQKDERAEFTSDVQILASLHIKRYILFICRFESNFSYEFNIGVCAATVLATSI